MRTLLTRGRCEPGRRSDRGGAGRRNMRGTIPGVPRWPPGSILFEPSGGHWGCKWRHTLYRIAIQPEKQKLTSGRYQAFSDDWVESLTRAGHEPVLVDTSKPDFFERVRACEPQASTSRRAGASSGRAPGTPR